MYSPSIQNVSTGIVSYTPCCSNIFQETHPPSLTLQTIPKKKTMFFSDCFKKKTELPVSYGIPVKSEEKLVEYETFEHKNCSNTKEYSDSDELFEVVKKMVKKGIDLNQTNSLGCTPLLYACRGPNSKNHLQTINFLIENGARVDTTDTLGNTPLHELFMYLE